MLVVMLTFLLLKIHFFWNPCFTAKTEQKSKDKHNRSIYESMLTSVKIGNKDFFR